MLASLPWYEVPGTEALYDALWAEVRGFLKPFSHPIPTKLTRGEPLDKILTSPDLLVSQTCGFDIAEDLPVPLAVVGSFSYGNPHGTYTSFLVTHEKAEIRSLADLARKTFVANDPRSFSGFHVMRQLFADPSKTFRQIYWSGSHLESLKFLQARAADLAAIDSVTYSLLRKFAPHYLKKTRLIFETEPVPAPPLVTSAARSKEEVAAIRAAFQQLFQREKSRAICHELLIEGMHVWPREEFQKLAAPAPLKLHAHTLHTQ